MASEVFVSWHCKYSVKGVVFLKVYDLMENSYYARSLVEEKNRGKKDMLIILITQQDVYKMIIN